MTEHTGKAFCCNPEIRPSVLTVFDRVPKEPPWGWRNLVISQLITWHRLVLLYFSSQLWLKRPKSQQESHRYETKASHHPSLSFPGSRVTCSKTGAQCQIWLKAGPPGHGAGGLSIWKVGVWLGVGANSTWPWWGVLFFPFVQLNLGSKLFHSFYLEGSPHLEKTWSQDFLLDGNST